MRYTQRKKELLSVDIDGTEHWVEYISISDSTLAHEKLCQLEDIEEEFGIDLVTFVRAFTDGIYACPVSLYSESFIPMYDNEEKCFYDEFQDMGAHWTNKYYFNEYGKTWALTKEELE